jgi:hypothetical protein
LCSWAALRCRGDSLLQGNRVYCWPAYLAIGVNHLLQVVQTGWPLPAVGYGRGGAGRLCELWHGGWGGSSSKRLGRRESGEIGHVRSGRGHRSRLWLARPASCHHTKTPPCQTRRLCLHRLGRVRAGTDRESWSPLCTANTEPTRLKGDCARSELPLASRSAKSGQREEPCVLDKLLEDRHLPESPRLTHPASLHRVGS